MSLMKQRIGGHIMTSVFNILQLFARYALIVVGMLPILFQVALANAAPLPGFLTATEIAWLKEHPVIRVANDPNWAPLEFINANGELQGVSRDYLDKLEAMLGVRFETGKNLTWSQAYEKVKKRELDMFSSLRPSPERQQFVNFTDQYISHPIMIFARDDVSYISDLGQLSGRRVAGVKGYATYELLETQHSEIELVSALSIEDSLRLLAKGEVDAFIGNIITTTYYLNKLGLSQIKVVGETPYRYGQTMAARKDWPLFVSILDKALKAIPQDEHNAIQQRWMPISFEFEPDYSWLWKPLVAVLLIFAVIAYWNRRLAREVAARKETELALNAQQQRLNDVFKVTPSGLWDWDMVTDECFCSPAYFEILGYDAQGFEVNNINAVWLDLIHPDDKAQILALHEASATSDEPFSKEYRLRCKDGSYKWILDKGQVVERNSQGDPIRMIGTYVDIEGFKQLELALKAQQQRLDDIFKVTPSGIWDWDKTTNLCYCSPAYFEMLGYDGKGFDVNDINTTWLDLLHPDDKERTLALYDESANSATSFSQEYRLRCKNGDYKWILDRGQVVARNEAGEPIRMVGAHVDIDVFKQLENQLREAKEGAEAANLAKSIFLANMSHELRTPLNAVLGFSEMMTNDELITPAHKENLHIINSSGHHLLDLINGVLDMSKIEAGHATLDIETTDLHRLLRDVEKMLEGRASKKGLYFALDLKPLVPQFVNMDGGKVKQILINLVGNAIKFTEKGSIVLMANAEQAESGLWQIYLAVQDSGVGISDEKISLIFEPFVQAGSGASERNGTGLGLAISNQFATLMNGTLSVDSEVGKGSLFSLEITVSADSTRVEGDIEEQQIIIALAEDEPEWRVLIVEDQASNRILLRSQLERVGFKVHEAFNGQEGVEAFLLWQPHLIWMDMRMPEMDGYEATRRIRALPGGQAAKILALTASAFQEETSDVLAAGCDDVHCKPYFEQEMLAAIGNHLPLRYQYRVGNAGVATQDTASEFCTQDIGNLPRETVARVLETAQVGDIDELQVLIRTLPAEHASVQAQLERYINDFQLQQLIDVLESVTE